jgi:hypothetical protein
MLNLIKKILSFLARHLSYFWNKIKLANHQNNNSLDSINSESNQNKLENKRNITKAKYRKNDLKNDLLGYQDAKGNFIKLSGEKVKNKIQYTPLVDF